VLPGHRDRGITTHSSAPAIQELFGAANGVVEAKSGNGGTETEVGRRLRRIPIEFQVLSGAPEEKKLDTGPSAFHSLDRQQRGLPTPSDSSAFFAF